MINSWSFSSLQIYEQCPHRAKLKYIERIPEPQNKYSERGTALHDNAETFVRGDIADLHTDLKTFSPELKSVRDLYAQGKVYVEQEWAYTTSWDQTEWRANDAWLRLKLDFFIFLDDVTGMVVDLKSGKKIGNEIKHAEQSHLYTGVSFLRFPQLKQIITEFWYVDQNDMTQVKYTPPQAVKFLSNFDKRARKMTDATEFPARPSIFTCKWCPYRPQETGGDGSCKYGINNITLPRKKIWK